MKTMDTHINVGEVDSEFMGNMKKTAFWDIAPCSLAEVYRRFGGACCLHHQGDE
jgi:hypothetical protein